MAEKAVFQVERGGFCGPDLRQGSVVSGAELCPGKLFRERTLASHHSNNNNARELGEGIKVLPDWGDHLTTYKYFRSSLTTYTMSMPIVSP